MGGKSSPFSNPLKLAGTLTGANAVGSMFSGAKSLGSGGAFAMTPEAQQAERDAIALQQQVVSGQAPSIAAKQYQLAQNQAQQAGLAQAAAARGVNPALAFRAANQATQMAQQDAGLQSAIMAEEERRNAALALANIASNQRNAALGGAQSNLTAKNQYRQQTMDFAGNLGGSAAKAAVGGK